MSSLLRSLETKISLLAAAALFLGFMDLIRGGITFSAILLSLAYCVLIPAWIWRRGAPVAAGLPRVADERQPSYRAAAAAGGAAFLLYLITLAPATAMWDASEYIAAAHAFGVPHPPGNPFFVIVGRFFSLLPLPIGIAARVNVFAALSSAVSAAMWFLVAERILTSWMPHRWQRLTGGAIAALVSATAFTVWTQSVVNEKVYTLALTGIALVSWLTIRWLDDPKGPGSDRYLILIAYLCGLGYANHMAGMLAAPAVAAAVLFRAPGRILRMRLILTCVGVMILGFTPFATQPIRAGYNPPINEGGVTGCTTHFELSCTFSRTTLDRFLYNFNRGQYSKPPVTDRQAPFTAQTEMWWQYFTWQWLRDPFHKHSDAQAAVGLLFFLLGGLGAWVHWKRDRITFSYFGTLMVLMTVGLIFYLNFKYGYSQAPALRDVEREVRDRDYFYLWSFSAWGVWVAVGLAAIWAALATRILPALQHQPSTSPSAASRRWLYSSPVLLVALIPLFANFSSATRHDDRVTSAWARDLLNSVEPYGVLFVVGDNDTFPLWYAQEVENVRKDVVVAIGSLLGTDWYPRQLILRPVYDYDAAAGPAIYRNREWKKPPGPPLKMSLSEADSVPERLYPPRPMSFSAHGIEATINPADLEYGLITRSDIFVLRIILDAFPERPVYFSRSAGPYPGQLGVSKYLLSQGLAEKLHLPRTATSPSDTVLVDGLGLFDVPRSLALWNDVYTGPDALIKRGRWIDEPSVTIPLLYVVAGSELAHLLHLRGDTAASSKVFERTRLAAAATSVPGIVARLDASRAK